METVIGFRGDAGNLKKEIQEVDSMQRQMGTDSLNRTLEEGRQKTKNAKDLLDYVKEEQRVKQANITLDRQSADQEAKFQRDQNRQELGGAKISIKDDNRIETSYREDLAANQEQEKLSKENLILQNAQLEELKKLGRAQTYTPEGQERLRQADIMSGTEEEGYSTAVGQSRLPGEQPGALSGMIGKFGAMLGAGALAAGAWSLFSHGVNAAASSESGESFDIKMKQWIPIVGGVLTAGDEKALGIKQQWQDERAATYGLTGKSARRMGWGSRYGMTSIQLASEFRTLAEDVDSENIDYFQDVMASRKAFGFSRGQSMKVAGFGAYDTSNFGNTLGFLTSAVQGGDLSKVKSSNIVDAIIQLTESQGGVLSTVDTGTNMQLALALGTMSGGFGDKRLGRIMGTMNQSLTTPGTDFQKAINYKLLSGLEGMEGASWIDLQIAQEKGVAQKGMLKATMDEAINRGGGNETAAILNLKNRLGLSTSEAKSLYESYQADPSVFDDIDGEMSTKEIMSGEKWRKWTGKQATGALAREGAYIGEGWIDSKEEGMQRVLDASETGKYIKQIAEDVVEAITVLSTAPIPINRDIPMKWFGVDVANLAPLTLYK